MNWDYPSNNQGNFNDNDEEEETKEFLRLNKCGVIINENYAKDYIEEDVFIVGELLKIQDNIIKIKSTTGNDIEIFTNRKNIRVQTKYVGIRATIDHDGTILETRGIIPIGNNVDLNIINSYIDIYMKFRNSNLSKPMYNYMYIC